MKILLPPIMGLFLIMFLGFKVPGQIVPAHKISNGSGNEIRTSYEIPGMTAVINLDASESLLQIKGQANCKGWICIGFNEQDAIIGADLKMLAIQSGELVYSDRKTIGFGDFPANTDLGGSNDIQQASGEIIDGQFHFAFSIPINSSDSFDLNLLNAKTKWLIMAYSQAPEFDHHSTLRKHLKFELPANK